MNDEGNLVKIQYNQILKRQTEQLEEMQIAIRKQNEYIE